MERVIAAGHGAASVLSVCFQYNKPDALALISSSFRNWMLTEDVTCLRQSEGGILLFFNLCCLWEIIDHCQRNLHQHVWLLETVGLYVNPAEQLYEGARNTFRNITRSTFSWLCDTQAAVFQNIVMLYGMWKLCKRTARIGVVSFFLSGAAGSCRSATALSSMKLFSIIPTSKRQTKLQLEMAPHDVVFSSSTVHVFEGKSSNAVFFLKFSYQNVYTIILYMKWTYNEVTFTSQKMFYLL